MSVQLFWNLFQLLGVLKLANLCQNFATEMCKQRSETSRRRLCCEKLSTSDDVKGFAIGSFLERIVVERAKLMMTSVRKTLKTLVWLVENRSVSSKICPENNHKICCFFIDCFPAKFAPKILAKSCKIGRFFRDFVPKNPAKICLFFPRPIRRPVWV